MKLKELRQTLEEMHANHPEADEAEVKLNIEYAVVDLAQVAHFIPKGLIVLFPVGVTTGTMAPTREELEKLKKQAEGQ